MRPDSYRIRWITVTQNNSHYAVQVSVVMVSETDTETYVFAKKNVRRQNLGFSAIIDGFWAHLDAKIM